MITLGLVNELNFIERHFRSGLKCQLDIAGKKVNLIISNSVIEVFYGDILIWKEKLEEDGVWFGIESCDNIFKIIECIDNNDESWREKYFWEPHV